jgi:hypothetical protein
MRTPSGNECPWFFGDYFRGKNVEECRLLDAAGQRWSRELCVACPVPGIARANACEHLKLLPTIGRPLEALFRRRVQIAAYCSKAKQSVAEAQIGCGQCHALPGAFKFGP